MASHKHYVVQHSGYLYVVAREDLKVASRSSVEVGAQVKFQDGVKTKDGVVRFVGANEQEAIDKLPSFKSEAKPNTSFHEDRPRKAALQQRSLMSDLANKQKPDVKKKAQGRLKALTKKRKDAAVAVMEEEEKDNSVPDGLSQQDSVQDMGDTNSVSDSSESDSKSSLNSDYDGKQDKLKKKSNMEKLVKLVMNPANSNLPSPVSPKKTNSESPSAACSVIEITKAPDNCDAGNTGEVTCHSKDKQLVKSIINNGSHDEEVYLSDRNDEKVDKPFEGASLKTVFRVKIVSEEGKDLETLQREAKEKKKAVKRDREESCCRKGTESKGKKCRNSDDGGEGWSSVEKFEESKQRKRRKGNESEVEHGEKKSKKRKSKKSKKARISKKSHRTKKVRRNWEIYPGNNYLFNKEIVGAVKLHEDFEVYVLKADLDKALLASTVSIFIRQMVAKIYKMQVLEGATPQGFMARGKGKNFYRNSTPLPRMDPAGLEALMKRATDEEEKKKVWRPKLPAAVKRNVFTVMVSSFKPKYESSESSSASNSFSDTCDSTSSSEQ